MNSSKKQKRHKAHYNAANTTGKQVKQVQVNISIPHPILLNFINTFTVLTKY